MSKNFSYEDALTPPNAGNAFSYEDAIGEKPKRTWGEAIKDTGAQLAEGVNTTLGAIPSVVAPQSKAAGFFRDNAQYWRDQQSDVLKDRIAASDQRIQEAGKDGVMSQIGAAASEYWNDPAQAARLVATNLPSMAATLGTGAAAGLAAKGVAAARGLDAANKAALAAKYGTATTAATNAALNAGGARGEAFEDLQKSALAQGMTPEQAEQAGVSGSILPGVVGGVAGAISGKIGLEKAILGQATTGAAMRKAAGAFGAEMAGEQIEELAPKVATNYQVGRIDPGRTLTDDLGRTMVETAVGSGPGAVVAGGAAGLRGETPTNTPPAQDEFTTSPGAADPNAPRPQATPPEAPDLTTSPGAVALREGLDFTRDVDTTGLTLEAPAEVERARAATMDYEPTDATPQWDTTRGAAAQDRQPGLDIPAPEFDTGALGLESRSRAMTPSQQMGIDPVREQVATAAAQGGALSPAALTAIDSGAADQMQQEARFLGATGRDIQVRRTGPGVADESNVIDVQGRVVEDRAIGTQSRLTAQESARESGAIAFREGVPRSEIAAIPNVIHRAQQLRGYDDAAQKASSVPALPAPTNLREGLERIRAQQQEAANAQAATPEAAPAAQAVSAARPGAVEAAGLKPAGQRQLSADEQAAQDREEARAKEPSLPPVLSARLQEAHKAHGRDVKRSVVERSIANEKANNTGTPKAKRERADRIARLEADLALFDEAAAMPPKEAAGLTENKVGRKDSAQIAQPESVVGEVQRSAAPSATTPTTTQGNTDGPQAAQTQQASPQPTQAAAPAAAAGLTDGATTPQNLGAQAAPAAGAQAQAPGNASWAALTPEQRRRARLEHEIATGMTNNGGVMAKLRPSAIEKRKQELAAMGDAGKLPSPGPAEPLSADGLAAQSQPAPATNADPGQVPEVATPAVVATPQPAPGPVRLGRDNRPLSEGGKPFKTRKAAGDAKKLQPMMRVVSVEGGYALAEKTPAQLAAEERASRRLRNPNTSAPGEPIPAHAFIAAAGGLNRVAAADMGVDGNPRIGNRTLFAGQGRGLSLDQATQMLIQDGYLSEGASINDALALIKTSLTRPQYNADGIERIAEAEVQAQFEDYLAAQEEVAQDDEFDPFGPAPATLDGFSDDMLESSGYDAATDAIKAEVRALLEMANAQGIDTESIMLEAHEQTRNATEQDYYEAAKSALEAAIAGSNRDRGTPAGREGQGPGAAATSAAEQRLNQPVALNQQAQAATENVAPAVSTTVEMPPTRRQESSPFARFATGRYRIAIRDEGNGPYAEVVAIQRGSGVEIEMRMPGEALDHPAFSQLNARAQALFETPTAGMFDAEPPALELASQTPAEWQTDSASERFSVGRSLTKAQRRQVLASLVDAYKAKGAQREFKGLDGNGNERYGYIYSPDLFEKSDITGAMIRYYVTLPDGRIAHPSELFPDVSVSDIERMALEQDRKRIRLDAFDNAIKPYYSDFDSANLMAVQGQIVIEKNGRFAIIPERMGAIGRARQNGWELASPSGQVSEQSAGTRAVREQQDGLTSYTAEEATQRQEAAEQAAKAEAARRRAADAQAARDEERKRIAQASVRAADSFELGQDPLDSLTGQGSIFDAPDQPQQAPAATEPVAQPITRADVEAAQQQAATLIAERIDAMTAGEVNTIARRFLPTMGVKPTISKERNKAAVTDFTKVNPMAAADEFGVTLPADVRRALDAEMQGKVVDAGQDDGATEKAAQTQTENPTKTGVFFHSGLKIYPVTLNVGGEVKSMWAVQTLNNADREANGERQLGGDPVSETIDGAKRLAEMEVASAKRLEEYSAAMAAMEAERAAAEAARKQANQGKTLSEIKAQKYLDALVVDGETGAQMTRAEWVKRRIDAGDALNTWLENKIKDKSRREWHRMDNREQAAHEKRVRDGGQVTKYGIGDYTVTKTEYDYAQKLLADKQEADEQQARADNRKKVEAKEDDTGNVVLFSRSGAQSANANDQTSRSWYDRFVILLPDAYRNDSHRREPLPAEDWNVQRAAEVRGKVESLNKQLRGENDRRGYGPISIDGLGNLQVSALQVSRDDLNGPIKALAKELGAGIAITNVRTGDIQALQDSGFVPEASLAPVADRIMGRPFDDPANRYAADARAYGTIMTYQPRGFPAVMFARDAAAQSSGQPLRTPVATIRAAITKAYGKLLGQLESKGLVTLTQTLDQAIEAAAQARAAKTGQSVERARATLRASVKNSVADQTQTEAFKRWFNDSKVVDAEGKPGRDTNTGMATNDVVGNQGGRSADDISPGASFDAQAAFEKHGGTGDIDESTDITAKSQAFADMAEAEGYTVIGRGDKYVTIKKSFGQDADGYAKTAIIKVRISDHSNVNRGNHFGETDINIAPDDGYSRDTFADALRKIQSAYVNDDLDTVIPSEPTASGLSDAADPDIRRSADGAIQGFFDPQTGQSFLIADNLTAEAAPGVLMHEVGIHMAADGSMKALFNRAAMMLKLQKGNPFMKAVQARMDAAGETSGEEAAAYIAEAYENDRANAPASVQRWLADLLAAVKAWMFKKGIMGADRLTVADIAAVARANARSMARDGGATGGQGTGAQSLERAMAAFSRGTNEAMTNNDVVGNQGGRSADDTTPGDLLRKLEGTQVVGPNGAPLLVYHGSKSQIDRFDASKTIDGGLHFGSKSQASMRSSKILHPAYLYAENLRRSKDTGGNWKAKIASAKAAGYDGIVYLNRYEGVSKETVFRLHSQGLSEKLDRMSDAEFRRAVPEAEDSYIVFDAKQVIQQNESTASDGSDAANPDIRFSRAGINTGGQAATGWNAPTPTGFDDVIYKLQDKNIDLKRVVESITKATGQVSDDINAYLKEDLFHKRAAKRVADFGARELTPLMNQMRLAGLSMEDVEEYLHARHAKEANAVIAQRNPGNAGLQDGGSGMTNAAADNYFAKLDPAQRRKLEAVAKSVDAIIEGTRKLYVDYGLEDQAVVDGWASMYQHYIPLMREDKDGGMGTGQGFSVKGKETKGRTGSTRKVVDILANVAMQREKLIVRGEKNIVAQALVGLAQANPNPDFWEVRSQAPTERVFDPKTGVVVDRPDPLFKSRENVAVAKVKDANGKVTEQMVVFNEDNPRAVRMAAALKNLDAGSLEGLLGVSAKITRYFAAINTQYNPVFGVVNMVRDVQGAMVNLGTTPLAGQQGKIAKDTLSALRGIYGDIRKTRKGGQATSQWSQLWEQMQDDGGTTGYRDLFKTSADRANDLKSILNPEGWMDSKWGKFFTADGRLKVPLSMAQKGATEIFGWLSDYNEAMENGVRLAAYKAALDKGMSREQAASLAKNLTVNFNRKGQAGMQAGAVYAFFNAAMQGTARIGQTLFDMDGGDLSTLRLSKTGKAVVYGGVMLGVMQALALSAAGFDDDDPPEFVRERSLIIPTGGKTYVSIPMPLGLHVIPGIGRHATEFALSGFDKPAKRAVSMVGMFADAFNPIGNAGLSMQTIAPTALDPLVALSENKDWTGKPIARVSSNKAMPGHTQWKDTATGFSKVVAEAINWISGGNEYVAGAFSPTPDQIDYLLAQVGGGVAREAAKVQQTITTAMSGETLPTHKIPLVGRFVGNAASQASQGSAFYANLNKLNELETEIKGLRKDGRFDEAAKLARENPQSMMIAMANRAERDVQRLRREKRELIANDASREQVRAKEDQITAVMTRLNEAVERRKAQAAR